MARAIALSCVVVVAGMGAPRAPLPPVTHDVAHSWGEDPASADLDVPAAPEGYSEGDEFAPETIVARRFTPGDVLAARERATWCVATTLDGEIGGYGYDPYRDGLAGEKGPGQLHPRGELRTFYARGFTDPHDPDQVVDFMEQRFSEGDARQWSASPRSC